MFDYLAIHCLATGKPIARIDDDEAGFILSTCNAASLERLALSSMRPSLPWLSVTPESLETIRTVAPRELLAYLLNRLYANVDTDRHGKPLDSDAWLNARRIRINNWAIISAADFTDDAMDSMLFLLLDLDSRFSLTKLIRPQSVTALWNTWHNAYAADLIKQLTQWRDTLVAAQVKKDKALAHAREFWSEGNRLTRTALANQFAKVAPTKAVVRREAKAALMKDSTDFLDQLEQELMERSLESQKSGQPVETVSVAVKVPVKLFKFGVKKVEG